jgi:ribosomal protein S16
VDEALAVKWMVLGAQYSDTVRTLFKAKGVIAKFLEAKKAK